MTLTYSVILGSRLPIHNRCPSCREPSDRMDAFSRGRVLVSASINLYEILKEKWTFRQGRSNTVWTWDFKFSSTNIYSRKTCPGQSFKGLGYSTTRALAPVPLGQLLWPPKCKKLLFKVKGVWLCVETRVFLFWSQRLTGQEAKVSITTWYSSATTVAQNMLWKPPERVLMTLKKMGRVEQQYISSSWTEAI